MDNAIGFPNTRGGTPYDGLYKEDPPERCTLIRLQVYERVGISLVEIYEKERKSLILVCERVQKGQQMNLWLYKVEKTFYFVTDYYLKDSAFTTVKRDAMF